MYSIINIPARVWGKHKVHYRDLDEAVSAAKDFYQAERRELKSVAVFDDETGATVYHVGPHPPLGTEIDPRLSKNGPLVYNLWITPDGTAYYADYFMHTTALKYLHKQGIASDDNHPPGWIELSGDPRVYQDYRHTPITQRQLDTLFDVVVAARENEKKSPPKGLPWSKQLMDVIHEQPLVHNPANAGKEYTTLWRAVVKEEGKPIRFDRLGMYWTLNKDKAVPYWIPSHTGESNLTIEGVILVANIDWDATVGELLAFSRGEDVIQPKVGAPIKVVSLGGEALDPPIMGEAYPLYYPGGDFQEIPDSMLRPQKGVVPW